MTGKYPKISIVTPNYNGSRYLEETIKSVLGQNYPNLEYIIIDGGSTDGSIDIIKGYESKLTYWISEPDNGMYHAIQKGFNRSTGEIMAWINSDDLYHPNSFFTVSDIFSSLETVNWLVGSVSIFDKMSRTVNVNQSRMFSKFDFFNGDYGWIQQESVFWRRSLWNKVGATLKTNLKYAGDFALWLSFISVDHLYVTSALLGGFRYQGNSQLSLAHRDDYIREVQHIYSQLVIPSGDQIILKRFRNIQRIEKYLEKFKIIRVDWLSRRFKTKYFEPLKMIVFDPNQLKFCILNHEY